MRGILAIAGYTLRQHMRQRVYLSMLLFGVLLLGASVLVSTLAVAERLRILVDIGLAGIEFLALLAVVFTMVNLVLDEVESRSIYLVLTRPLERWHYVVGRYTGTLAAVAGGMALMALAHVVMLKLYGWAIFDNGRAYALAWLCAFGKIALVGAVALLFSLFSTSAASSMAFTVFFWIMGHLSEEIRFLGEKSASLLVQPVVWVIYNLTPNFTYFNYRDFWDAAQTPPAAWFGWMAVYAVSYTAACVYLACFLFEEKEL